MFGLKVMTLNPLNPFNYTLGGDSDSKHSLIKPRLPSSALHSYSADERMPLPADATIFPALLPMAMAALQGGVQLVLPGV
jgi:hypothetical protein